VSSRVGREMAFATEGALGLGGAHRGGCCGGSGQGDFELGDEALAAGGGLKEHLAAKGQAAEEGWGDVGI
jgi:hypothetical protein